MTEKYQVLPSSDPEVRDGLYQAFYQRTHMIAMGNYANGKRVGIWRYFNPRGATLEVYNFDKDSLVFEAFENKRSDLHYFVDKELTDSDKTTKPYKAGGRYYGYLPYLNAFKTPFAIDFGQSGLFTAEVELVISPLGRLADYKVHLVGPDYDQKIDLALIFFKEEDKQFIPAKINGQPVISRIIIKCRVTDDGGLDFY